MKLNRRIKFLLGFGGLAVVLLVVFNMWYPPVNDDAATGAVGAVKKHRQQQIAAQDVVLGDEASRKQEQILYADYLEDAATLENVSAELAMALRNRGAQDADLGSMRATLAAAGKSLDAQSSKLEAQALASARSALESMNAILVRLGPAVFGLDMRQALEADLQSIATSIENISTLESADIEALSACISRALPTSSRRGFSAPPARLEMKSRLDAVRRDLENRQATESSLESARTEIGLISRDLGKSRVSGERLARAA